MSMFDTLKKLFSFFEKEEETSYSKASPVKQEVKVEKRIINTLTKVKKTYLSHQDTKAIRKSYSPPALNPLESKAEVKCEVKVNYAYPQVVLSSILDPKLPQEVASSTAETQVPLNPNLGSLKANVNHSNLDNTEDFATNIPAPITKEVETKVIRPDNQDLLAEAKLEDAESTEGSVSSSSNQPQNPRAGQDGKSNPATEGWSTQAGTQGSSTAVKSGEEASSPESSIRSVSSAKSSSTNSSQDSSAQENTSSTHSSSIDTQQANSQLVDVQKNEAQQDKIKVEEKEEKVAQHLGASKVKAGGKGTGSGAGSATGASSSELSAEEEAQKALLLKKNPESKKQALTLHSPTLEPSLSEKKAKESSTAKEDSSKGSSTSTKQGKASKGSTATSLVNDPQTISTPLTGGKVITSCDFNLRSVSYFKSRQGFRLIDIVDVNDIDLDLQEDRVKSLLAKIVNEEFDYDIGKVNKILKAFLVRDVQGSQYLGEEIVLLRALVPDKNYLTKAYIAPLRFHAIYNPSKGQYCRLLMVLFVGQEEVKAVNKALPDLISKLKELAKYDSIFRDNLSREDVWQVLARVDWKFAANQAREARKQEAKQKAQEAQEQAEALEANP